MARGRRWISAEVDNDTHDLLYKLATKRGIHPSVLIAEFISNGLVKQGEDNEGEIDFRVYAAAQKVQRARSRNQNLDTIAWEVAHNQDEVLFETLEQLCEESGQDVNEVIKRARKFPSPPIFVGHNATGSNAAMRWLQDRFRERREWPAAEIRDLGKRQGFSKNILGTAKRQLGIASIRRSNHWIWTENIEEDAQN